MSCTRPAQAAVLQMQHTVRIRDHAGVVGDDQNRGAALVSRVPQ
jgi:hypothetical protein